MSQKHTEKLERPPIVVIMGHVDHGKSTLLDYIRKSNITAGEAGGITQHIGAYEVVHKLESGEEKKITFLDTPGHAAFSNMRERGAGVADIAVLVVAADDGVKAQTLEALKTIQDSKTPFLVAINKIDRPGADVMRSKQQLAEAGVYVEGFGGNVSCVEISAKTGAGIPDLLETILLQSELEELVGNPAEQGSGVVIESHVDSRKGVSATLIIRNGTVKKGDFLLVGNSISPIRSIENFLGAQIDSASLSQPIRIVGLVDVPTVGTVFSTHSSKKEAEQAIKENAPVVAVEKNMGDSSEKLLIPIVLKADAVGTLEAIENEVRKQEKETIGLKFISKSVGTITETDVKNVIGSQEKPIIIGFNVKVDRPAKDSAERAGIPIMLFDIIYKLSEWVEEELTKRKPVITEEFVEGRVKVVKAFSRQKDRQIIGGTVLEGAITVDRKVRILRHQSEIGTGTVINIEQSRQKTDSVASGKQFGAVIESKMEIADNDLIEVIGVLVK